MLRLIEEKPDFPWLQGGNGKEVAVRKILPPDKTGGGGRWVRFWHEGTL